MIENGMVVGAQEAYDAMFPDDAWENRTRSDVLDFAINTDIGGDVIGWYLNAPKYDEDAAREIAETCIQAGRFVDLVERYVEEKNLYNKFNEWKRG